MIVSSLSPSSYTHDGEERGHTGGPQEDSVLNPGASHITGDQ